MTATLPPLSKLKPNPAWASLPLFDRTGWKRVRFGDVVMNCNETCDPEEAGLVRFVAMEHLEPGSLHVKSWGDVADGTTFTRRCRAGQVLFGKRRAYQRKVAVAEFEAVVSGDIYVLAPKDTQRLLPELLPFLCLSERFFQHAIGTSAGSLSPRTNWSSLASFEFDLPPLDQQRRIAEILWAVDTEWNCYLGVKTALEDYRKSLFGNRLSAFKMKPLAEAVEFLDGKRVPLSEKERAKRKGPYPYYGASGVIDSVDDYIFDEPLVLLSEDGFNLVNRNSRIAFKVDGMSFTESNTVEQMILDAATSLGSGAGAVGAARGPAGGLGRFVGRGVQAIALDLRGDRRKLPRQPGEVMVEPWVREALIALNPEIAAQPDRADEVIYALRAILLSVQGDGLVRANENFMAWLRGEKTMPFGPNGEHVPVRLLDLPSRAGTG
jgi:hypothetical protein